MSFDTGHLGRFLMHVDKSMEFQNKMATVETACEIQYEGANLFKYINILVCLAFYLLFVLDRRSIFFRGLLETILTLMGVS